MSTLTVSEQVLQHLGINPGDKIELELLPGGRGQLSSSGTLDGFIGLLAGKSEKVATLEEMNLI